jgi:glycosyltransferase involved in cell wall biosynthesis
MKTILKPGITVFVHTLNNRADIAGVLSSICKSRPDQIIVADGGSIDGTAEIARQFTSDVVVTEPGFVKQSAKGVTFVKYDHFLLIEPDHRYPDNFIQDLKNEFDNSNFVGLQATVVCQNKRNYFEKGFSCFYEINQEVKGKREIIGGPSLFKTDFYLEHLQQKVEGFSADTQKAEIVKKLGVSFGLAHTAAYHYEDMGYPEFYAKYFKYGRGDHIFYTSFSKEWTLLRKLKSVTHIARRYFFNYPSKAILRGDLFGASFIIWAGLIRYYAWIRTYIESIIKKSAT